MLLTLCFSLPFPRRHAHWQFLACLEMMNADPSMWACRFPSFFRKIVAYLIHCFVSCFCHLTLYLRDHSLFAEEICAILLVAVQAGSNCSDILCNHFIICFQGFLAINGVAVNVLVHMLSMYLNYLERSEIFI